MGLSGLVPPTAVLVAGTKYKQKFCSHFRLLHKHFQRLGKILGLVGAGLCAGWALGENLDILGVGATNPGAVGNPGLSRGFGGGYILPGFILNVFLCSCPAGCVDHGQWRNPYFLESKGGNCILERAFLEVQTKVLWIASWIWFLMVRTL